MPSTNAFERQDEAYKQSVLPDAVTRRVAVEAGVREPGGATSGPKGEVVGIDHFGASAPAKALFEHYGFTVDNVIAKINAVLGRLNGTEKKAKRKKRPWQSKWESMATDASAGTCCARCTRAKRTNELQIVAINDLGDAKTNAHLTRFDTAHGRFNGDVHVDGDAMVVNGDRIRVVAQRDPGQAAVGRAGVEVVLECTGLFTSKAKAAAHIAAAPRRS